MRTIEQTITATHNFNGGPPVGTPVAVDGMTSYPTAITGGLFDFGQDTAGIEVAQVFIKLGGQSSWSLSLVDNDATLTVVASGTTETFYANPNWGLILLQHQTLKLVTSGASGAMKARVTARKAQG
jgi:hypothetical protein